MLSLVQSFGVTLCIALAFVGLVGVLSERHVVSNRSARKLMHIGTGPLFMLTWQLYPPVPDARYVAALVPLLMALRFAAVGLGLLKDPALVAGATRRGARQELLRGPLAYGLVHAAACLWWWRDSPSGVLALAVLCGGDGAAEVLGSRWGHLLGQLPHNKQKTIVGSLACWVAGWLVAAPLLLLFNTTDGNLELVGGAGALSTGQLLGRAAAAALVGAGVESLPILQDWDNVTVPLATGLVADWLYGTVR